MYPIHVDFTLSINVSVYKNNCCNNSNNEVKNISRYNMTPFLLFFDQSKKNNVQENCNTFFITYFKWNTFRTKIVHI